MNTSSNEINIFKIVVIIISLSFSFCSSPIESESLDLVDNDLEKTLQSIEIEDLSLEEIEGLIFMREEEKLARDVYTHLFNKWSFKVFSNISESEQRHTDAIKLLSERYNLDDPMTTDEEGIFKNEELQNLYDNLIDKGSESLVSALEVGAAIEEIDIIDLENQVSNIVDNEDIKYVYNNLLRGSRNHLRAFVRNMSSQGEVYEPQYLEISVYQEIINSDMERGRRGKNR